MKTAAIFALVLAMTAIAGPRFGGRIGHTSTEDPFTGLKADGAIYGGQVSFPLLPLLNLELSSTYNSSQSDISMENYLVNYIEEEYGINYENDIDGLMDYLENEWGWNDPTAEQMLENYTATYHDLGMAGILRADIPLGVTPFSPYLGGGAGVHFIVSDADVMLAAIEQQTTGQTTIDPYDHVFPSVEGVFGMTFKPMLAPVSVFGEVRLSKPFGEEAGNSIVTYYGGVNLGF